MQADTCIHGKTFENMPVHHRVIASSTVRGDKRMTHNGWFTTVHAVGTAGDIHHYPGKTFIQGNTGFPETANTGLIP